MHFNLDLAYRMKPGEEQNFLEPFEIEEVNDKIRSMAALLGPEKADEARQRARELKDEYIASIGSGSFAPRISAYLFRSAVELRYRNKEGRIEVPRKGAEKTKPGVWWGDLTVQFEDYPATLDVPVIVAQWLVTTWFDDKVQNGLDSKVQAWANVFEKEMERVKEALEAKPEPEALGARGGE